MGQYWKPVNLDKREFIHPHKLDSGLKLWECLAAGGVGRALIVLQAAMPCARGGGDLDVDENWHGPDRKDFTREGPPLGSYAEVAKRTIGRWAGDRVALVGDYAEDDDIPGQGEGAVTARQAYALCGDFDADCECGRCPCGGDRTKHFRDVTADVIAVLDHELHADGNDRGWRR